jgi:hypothetical protein
VVPSSTLLRDGVTGLEADGMIRVRSMQSEEKSSAGRANPAHMVSDPRGMSFACNNRTSHLLLEAHVTAISFHMHKSHII